MAKLLTKEMIKLQQDEGRSPYEKVTWGFVGCWVCYFKYQT